MKKNKMRMIIMEIVAICLFLLPGTVLCTGFIEFYNDRYSDVGINYNGDDSLNGVWGWTDDYLIDLPNSNAPQDTVHTGCSYDTSNFNLSGCTGDVYLDGLSIVNITNGALLPSVTSLTIYRCPNFELFEQGTFDLLTSLTTLIVQRTALNHVPDISNTAMETLNLAGNSITMTTNTHSGWTMPSSIKYLALMQNQIHWIPPGMVSGPNLRMASFAENQLTQINPNIFGDTSALIYFGAEKNSIKRLSQNTLAPLANENFKHLNLSHNQIYFVQPRTFSQLPNLTILELHENSFTTVQWDVFYDMPNLAHLDLHANAISALPSKSFHNLPKLRELRLHSQTDPMTRIAYNAWDNIGAELKYLFVSQNALTTFPHQVLEEGDYPNLLIIFAEENSISNITEYGSEAFTNPALWRSKLVNFTPFSTYPNLVQLRLSRNDIQYINSSDLCRMANLEVLYLNGNDIREAYLDNDAFACLTNLQYLYLQYNDIQYVPDALKSSTVLPAILLLNLEGNHITFLEQYNSFSNITTLVNLDLSHNEIVAIENEAFPTQLSDLDLQYNDFRFLHENPFTNMSSLKRDLGYNDFRFLHENPFTNLSSLTRLRLSDNDIDYLPSTALHGCSALNTLELDLNNIPQLLSSHFRDTPLASELNMASNDLGYIEPGTFSHHTSYGTITLSSNSINRLPAGDFSSVTMNTLDLDNNRITFLETEVFKDLVVNNDLILSNNYITSIEPYAFSNVNVQSLHLGSNTLTYLYPYAFNNVAMSGNLDLQGSTITTIQSRVFNGVSANQLLLQNGRVTTIEAEAFYDVTVTELDLSSNQIGAIIGDIFGGTSSISSILRLNNNTITTISSTALNNAAISEIDLSNNQLTIYPQTLTNQTFSYICFSIRPPLNVAVLERLNNNMITTIIIKYSPKQRSISQIDLSNNKLTIYPQTLTNQTFTYINLDSNTITEIPAGSLSGQTSLQTFNLDSNNITEIPAGSLSGQTSLQTLYLSNNRIVSLSSGIFDDLTAIRTLSLSSNNIASLHTAIFNTMTNLETLLLYGNQLTHFDALTNNHNLETLSLSSNSLQTVEYLGFSALTSLTSLQLGSNQLECSCQLLETIDAVSNAVSGATCSSPAETNGVDLSNLSSATHYSNFTYINATKFQCAGASLTGNLTNSKEFTVTWYDPSLQYFETDPAQTPTPLDNVTVTYNIICITSTGAATLTQTETANVLNVTSSHTVTFVEGDGVVSGTTYECSVTMELDGYVSGKSSPVVLTTADDIATPLTPGANDLVLEVKYHDFNRYHVDFHDLNYVSVTNPSYVASPYGAWLAASTSPTTDTFSTWFRFDDVGNNNYELNDTLILADQLDSSKLYWTDSFYPVDGRGFMSESQQDCSGTYHNFGFTSAIRAGLVYSGTEQITLAGGEALWLYINKIQILEYIASGLTTTECFVIDLSTATYPGGTVTPQVGTLSSGTCTSLVAASTNISLALEVGVTYHFDLFHAETRLCSSVFLLHVSGTTLSQNFTEYAPLDYDVSVDEDTQVGTILQTVTLTDDFSVGGYSMVLESGNEARRFDIKDNTYTFTPTPVTLVYTNMTDINGNDFAFIECTSASTSPTFPNDLTTETFSISTNTALVTLKAEIDFESVTSYMLRFTVVDNGKSLTGSAAIRITIVDTNDNCPTLTPTSLLLSPEPVLQTAAIATFTTSDVDSGENGNVYFIVSEIIEDPAVDFDDSYDLWGDVYLRYTSLNFTVVAIDNGTIQRGAVATVSMNVSNTCVLDVTFGDISYMFHVNASTGELTYRVPKYYMYDFSCTDRLGLVSGHVLDSMLSASSQMDKYSGPGRARLDLTEDSYSNMLGGWVAGTNDVNQYIEVDMNSPYKFTRIFIQGRSDADQWVEEFKILYFNSTTGTWDTYTNSSGSDTFTGNTDRTTVVTYDLDPAILSQKVRINPRQWNGKISLRFEMSGCSQAEQLYYDVSCQQCETSYYCEGDGVRKLCGRCENTSATCDRNPAEHSYGLASECTSCPAGRICQNGTAYICDQFYYIECTNTSCPSACSPCEVGYACKDGIRTQCREGTYSDGLMEQCTSCPTGTYQNQTGQGSCIPCDAGYFSATGMAECSVCTNDKYSLADGSGCQACADATECPCKAGNVCHSQSLCYNTGNGGYGCLSCGDGLSGNGHTCADTDECTIYTNLCYQGRCINTDPGFQCLECPEGYSGTYEDGLTYNVSHRVFLYRNLVRSNFTYQTCTDDDECTNNNGGCDTLMTCVNTPGSFYCDFCAAGYMGTNKTGCYLDDYCISGNNTCNTTVSDCIYLGPAQYKCKCKPGYAGTGPLCGIDTDMDGRPDTGLSCTDDICRKDNCVTVPNSYQDDTDSDSSGDNCDADDDSDGRYDYLDNCQYVSNFDQTDSNLDGVGDVCSLDSDADGIDDAVDNCPSVSNSGQADVDNDGIGDACDNCPSISNVNQDDVNVNGVGDACETVSLTNIDEDGDGVLDSVDNCPSYMNSDQADTDNDGTGDLCDSDIDNDSIANDDDNCIYVSNNDQSDADGNNVGDACEGDSDGDGVSDLTDNCRFDASRQNSSFSNYFTVVLDPASTSALPNWLVKSDGSEVEQTVSTDMPVMLIGEDMYGAVEYAGTWFTHDASASDFIGLVFGHVSNQKFYLVTWKAAHYNYLDLDQSTYKAGIQGPQIKLVDSTVGPSAALTQAIWHSDDTTNHVTILWQDPSLTGWSTGTPYRWYLTHRPTTGYINLKIYTGTSLLINSGSLYDYTITGGRLGVFQFGAFPMLWSHLVAECLDHTNQGLYLDGVDDFVTLSDVVSLHMDKSFTIEAWIKLDSGFTSGQYPIVCTGDTNLCFWVDGDVLKGKYGTVTVTGTSSLTAGSWHNVIFRHSISSQSISVFLDSVLDTQSTVSSIFNWTSVDNSSRTLYIGRDNSSFFRGTVDEVRFYSEAILDSEITDHISLPSFEREILKYYGAVHFRMEESPSATALTNSGFLTAVTGQLSGGSFINSYQQPKQFQLAFPNN